MKFRIVAFPLASSSVPLSRTALRSAANTGTSESSVKARQTLYYYHFQIYPSEASTAAPPNLLRRTVNKAIGAWSGMGRAPEGNWKRTIYTYGERLMDRIDFEESSLKVLHPPSNFSRSRAPSTTQSTLIKTSEQKSSSGTEQSTGQTSILETTIPLVYPSNFPSPLPDFMETIHQRTPLHRKGFWTWLIISPFTTPFAIVPVVPNLPFFFCAWRSWSHYRAWTTSDYLQYLLENGTVRPEPNDGLAEIYSERSSSSMLTPGSASGTTNSMRVEEKKVKVSDDSDSSAQGVRRDQPQGQEHEHEQKGDGDGEKLGGLLLHSSKVGEVVRRLGLQDRAMGEITKALEQAGARLEKAKSV